VQNSISRSGDGASRYPVLLIAIIAFSVTNIAIWLWIDTRPPRWDEAGYLRASLKYHEALTAKGAGGFVRALVEVDRKRPPLVPALAVPVYFLFGKSFDIALIVNLLAFVVLLLAVYKLGTRLVSSEAGVLAAFLVAAYPSVFSLARIFLLDFWNTTLVALALYLFVRAEGFSRQRASIALGAVLGFGLLCRPFFPVFVLGPLVVSLYAIWKIGAAQTEMQEPNQPAVGRYLKPAAVSFAVVAGPWYVINALPLLKRSLSAAYGAEAVGYGPSNPFTFQALASYLLTFINWHTTLAGTVLFVLA
jgi:4-amino-4-deoxy-L-arabinose transferase-like glycosyltransferase